MHIFAINDIAESAPRTHDTTFYCFDVKLPDRSGPGHVIADATDLADVEAYREHRPGAQRDGRRARLGRGDRGARER